MVSINISVLWRTVCAMLCDRIVLWFIYRFIIYFVPNKQVELIFCVFSYDWRRINVLYVRTAFYSEYHSAWFPRVGYVSKSFIRYFSISLSIFELVFEFYSFFQERKGERLETKC